MLGSTTAILTRCTDDPAKYPYLTDYINRTVLSDGWGGSLSDGSLTWPGIDRPAGFHVANQLVSPSEAAAIKAALQGQEFDRDPDTVDGETSFEYYLERNGGIKETLTNVPLKPDAYGFFGGGVGSRELW